MKCIHCRASIASDKRSYNSTRRVCADCRYNRYLLRTYGITLIAYRKLLADQSNRCAICGLTPDQQQRRLSIDHNHTTGRIRALLCSNCNHGLGKFKDSIDKLVKAIAYLHHHATPSQQQDARTAPEVCAPVLQGDISPNVND